MSEEIQEQQVESNEGEVAVAESAAATDMDAANGSDKSISHEDTSSAEVQSPQTEVEGEQDDLWIMPKDFRMQLGRGTKRAWEGNAEEGVLAVRKAIDDAPANSKRKRTGGQGNENCDDGSEIEDRGEEGKGEGV